MNEKQYFYKKMFRYLRDCLAILLILWGVFAALTPLTPGSWLVLVGFFIIFGRERTENWVEKIVGKKLFNKFGIAGFLKRIPKIKKH